jgi:hypothetical protein
LRKFLRSPLSEGDCRRIIAEASRGRERTFLRLLKRGVYDFPQSPYLALLRWAGAEFGDVERMVNADGIEAAMERLAAAGVHVSLDEFKGRRPIERPGLSLEVTAEAFDNPLLAGEFEVESGGSTGPRRRMKIDFDLLTYDAACHFATFAAAGVADRPLAIWRGVPPDSSGLKHGLLAAKLGRPMERWFSPTRACWRGESFQFAVLTAYSVHAAGLWGGPIPKPEYVPLSDGRPVARWLAAKAAEGDPAVLSAAASNAVRACVAAKEAGLNIAGSVFRVSGEPFTEAKHRLVAALGVRTFSAWSMAEAGPLGGGCANREAVDEVHLFGGKIAAFSQAKLLPGGQSEIGALCLTTVITSTPKIMLNLDSGDYGVLTRRRCGCPLELAGFLDHLHTIRNYEKLTAGGIHFLGSDIIRLVEEVLPAAHGGLPTDYQFVEEHGESISRVSILVSPRVGAVDEPQVVNTVLRFLEAQGQGGRLMSTFWEQGRTLRVVRREPYVTPASKTPPLRVLGK